MAGLSSPLAASSSSASCLSSSASLQGSTLLPKSFSPKFDNSCNKCRSLEIFAQKKVQKRRQVVLSQDVPLLGKTGQLVKVKPGYYRNYLFPYGKAKIATPEYLKEIRLEEERKEAEKRRIKQEAEADALMFKTIGGFSCRRKVGKGKQIFGQVTTQDLADIIKAQTSKVIDKRDITLPEVREIGEYIAEIKLHPEVTAQVRLFVIPN